jgi:hypothetical protein
MRLSVKVIGVFVALVACGLLAGTANASEPFTDTSVAFVSLQVNKRGEALVTYRRQNGTLRHVLLWGAVDALSPVKGVPQVHFQYDYAGGWRKYHNGSYWKTFRNACAPYDGPQLVFFVAACKAPDGTYWALQTWQRMLPHRGFAPWLPAQSAFDLRVSHWSGELAQLEVHTDWAFGSAADLFGRLTYRGQPVYGFGTTRNGIPKDGYGRSLFIDTFDSAYGPGWKRETSIVFRNPSGVFCYSFWPTRDVSLPGYPDNLRPAGTGSRYRITVPGPGVTPDVEWEGDGLGPFDPRNQAQVAHERDMNALLDQLSAGDKFCPTQH